jgi:hypothetical protein
MEVGGAASRLHQFHDDVLGGEFVGQRFGETFQRKLGRDVVVDQFERRPRFPLALSPAQPHIGSMLEVHPFTFDISETRYKNRDIVGRSAKDSGSRAVASFVCD